VLEWVALTGSGQLPNILDDNDEVHMLRNISGRCQQSLFPCGKLYNIMSFVSCHLQRSSRLRACISPRLRRTISRTIQVSHSPLRSFHTSNACSADVESLSQEPGECKSLGAANRSVFWKEFKESCWFEAPGYKICTDPVL